jgi:hypothetical protein
LIFHDSSLLEILNLEEAASAGRKCKETKCTRAYPTRCTILIEFGRFCSAERIGLFSALHTVDDGVLVEAGKVGVASLPAVGALVTIRRNEASVARSLGCFWSSGFV